jgi:hypothetical protein
LCLLLLLLFVYPKKEVVLVLCFVCFIPLNGCIVPGGAAIPDPCMEWTPIFLLSVVVLVLESPLHGPKQLNIPLESEAKDQYKMLLKSFYECGKCLSLNSSTIYSECIAMHIWPWMSDKPRKLWIFFNE